MQVVANPRVLLHHYWVGVDESLSAELVQLELDEMVDEEIDPARRR